jgi:sugar (pentulose or hexulose) kinase
MVLTGTFRFNDKNQPVPSFSYLNEIGKTEDEPSNLISPSQCAEIRGLIEGQFLSLRAHSQYLGLTQPKRLVVSGGASVNWTLLQVLADIFQAPVEVQTVKSKTNRIIHIDFLIVAEAHTHQFIPLY